MAFALHTLITFGGALGSGSSADRWQCGIRCGFDVGDGSLIPASDLAGVVAAVGPAIKTAFTTGSGAALAASDCGLDFVKAANIDTTGKYAATAGNPQIYSTGLPVTGGSGRIGPPMQALKLTWTTANLHGLGHTGGIYVPFLGYAGWNTSTISTTVQNDYRAWGKKFLDACHATVSGGTLVPVVASKKGGTLTRITGVKVGSVVDVQRRRKEQVPETYTTVLAFP